MLLTSCLRWAYNVLVFERSCWGVAAKATAISDRFFLSACQVFDWGELRAIIRTHGRVQWKVSTHVYHSSKYITNSNFKAINWKKRISGQVYSRKCLIIFTCLFVGFFSEKLFVIKQCLANYYIVMILWCVLVLKQVLFLYRRAALLFCLKTTE